MVAVPRCAHVTAVEACAQFKTRGKEHSYSVKTVGNTKGNESIFSTLRALKAVSLSSMVRAAQKRALG